MKAIVNTGKGRLEMQELALPEPGPEEVRIKTAACAICSTDFTMIDGCVRSHYPAVLGHEWSGIVDKAGKGVDSSLQGKPCVGENILDNRKEVGFELPGAYGEYFITRANKLYILPKSYSLINAALIEPLAVCLRGLKRLRLENRENALIFGDGSIGLLMLILLKRESIKHVIVVGGREARLKPAEQFGAECVVNYHKEKNIIKAIRAKSGISLFHNIVEAAGSSEALESTVKLSAKNAHILLIGDYDKVRTDIPWQNFLHQELELIAGNAGTDFWQDAFNLAVKKRFPLDKLISHIIPSDNFKEAIETARSKKSDAIKVVIEWVRE